MNAVALRAPLGISSVSVRRCSLRLGKRVLVSQLCSKKGTEDVSTGSETADSSRISATEGHSITEKKIIATDINLVVKDAVRISTEEQHDASLIMRVEGDSNMNREAEDNADFQGKPLSASSAPTKKKKKKLKSKGSTVKIEYSLLTGLWNIRGIIIDNIYVAKARVERFIFDWREMEEAMRPQPDPPGKVQSVRTWENTAKIPWSAWKLIIRETLYLQWQVMFDYAKAKEIFDEDDRILAAIDEEVRLEAEAEEAKRRKKEDDKNEDIVVTDADRADFDAFLDKLKDIASPKMVEDAQKITGIDDAIKFAKEHRVEGYQKLERVAADRMEAMGEVIGEFMVGYKEGKEASFKESSTDDEYLNKIVMPIYNTVKEKAIELKEEFEKGDDPNKKQLTEEEQISAIHKENERFQAELDFDTPARAEEDRIAVEKIKARADELFKDYYDEGDEKANEVEIKRKLKEAETRWYGGADVEEANKLKEMRDIEQVTIDAGLSYRRYFGGELDENVKELIRKKKIRESGREEVSNSSDANNGEMNGKDVVKASVVNEEDDEDDEEREESKLKEQTLEELDAEKDRLEVERITIDAAFSYKRFFGGVISEEIEEMIKKRKMREDKEQIDKENSLNGHTGTSVNKSKVVVKESEVTTQNDDDDEGDDDDEEDAKDKAAIEKDRLEVERITIDAAFSYKRFFGGVISEEIEEMIKKRKMREDKEQIDKENSLNGHTGTSVNKSKVVVKESEVTTQNDDDDEGDDDDEEDAKDKAAIEKDRLEVERITIDAAFSYKRFFGGVISEEIEEMIKKRKMREDKEQIDKENSLNGHTGTSVNKSKVVVKESEVTTQNDDDDEGDDDDEEDAKDKAAIEKDRLEVERITIDAALSYKRFFGGVISEEIQVIMKKRELREKAEAEKQKHDAD